MPNSGDRKISDADVEAIVQELQKQLAQKFYDDLGRGIWSALKTLAIAAALALAAWGYKNGSGH